MELSVIQVRAGVFRLPADREGTHPWPARRLVLDRDAWVEASPVSWRALRSFVEAGGYATPRFWPMERLPAERVHTRLGRLVDTFWRMERRPVEPSPARGLGWSDAWALSTWSASRLPLEAELKLIHERGGVELTIASDPEWTGDSYSALPLAGNDGRGFAWNPGVKPTTMVVRLAVAAPGGRRSTRLSASVERPREPCVARRVWDMPPAHVRVSAEITPDEPLPGRSN